MKKLWTIIILAGFISVLFGSVFSMAHESQHGYICLASQLNGSEAPCPKADPLGFASFHNAALKKISNLLLVNGFDFVYLALLFFGLLVSYLGIQLSDPFSGKFPAVSVFKLETRNYELATRKWFSLHEKRDPVSVF